MSKNGFGKQGSALLRRRWLAREKKRERERKPALGARKADIAERVESLLYTEEIQEAELQTQEQQVERETCRNCAAYGFCEFVRCGLKEAALQWGKC